MCRSLKLCLLLPFLLLSLNLLGIAQDPPPGKRKPWGVNPGAPSDQRPIRQGPPGGRRPPGPGSRFDSFEMFNNGKIVKGAPYSATAVTESVQTLADGTRISHKKTDTIYRDGEGRTRRELTFDRVGPFRMEGEPQQLTFINDAVAGTQIILDQTKQTARQMPLFNRPSPKFRQPPSSDENQRRTEDLGSQVIEGVEAIGTRTTMTIPAGRIGNDRPLEIVSERWESPALQVIVLSIHKDPFVGVTTYRLTDIKRAEPARELFEIPSNFTREQERPERPPSRDRHRRPDQ